MKINFWAFVLRCVIQAMSDTINAIELKPKPVIYAISLFLLGMLNLYLLRGRVEAKQELHKWLVLIAMPAVLAFALFILYNFIRAPYIVYSEEYARISSGAAEKDLDISKLQDQLRVAESHTTQVHTVKVGSANEAAVKPRLSDSDRAHIAEALYELAQIQEQANTVWGKANHVDADLAWNDFDSRLAKLRDVQTAAKDYMSAFSASRQKHKYFQEQLNYIFGDNPDNNSAKILSAADDYFVALDSLKKLNGKDEDAVRNLLSSAQNRYHPTIRDFELWVQACNRRLDEIRKATQ